jgi:hypothetical protein
MQPVPRSNRLPGSGVARVVRSTASKFSSSRPSVHAKSPEEFNLSVVSPMPSMRVREETGPV